MYEIEVNSQKISAEPGETILSALKRANIKVPTLCHMEGLPPSGACRICVVQVDGMGGLIPSCSYPVADGMRIQTDSPKVIRARKTIVELLLANHPDDCLYCVRNKSCQLQDLAEEYGIRERRFNAGKAEYTVDKTSPSIVRDQAKCILCGKCVRVCEEIQNVSAIDFAGRGCRTVISTAFNENLNVSSCINCGQCIMVCPTGALREKSYVKEVREALADPRKHVVVQHAPAISVTIAEEFGVKPGLDADGLLVAAFRQLGFDRVFDTSFSADLTIMEEASELVHRITNGGKLPMMTSCSPGWIKYIEEFYPEFLSNLSTCKSPQQMLGAMIKSYYAENNGIKPQDIFSVSVMPCTAKKFEIQRSGMGRDNIYDVDAVLSTREIARLIRMSGIDFNRLDPSLPDNPFGERSSAGKIFGASGGVMEAAVRTAHYLVTGKELDSLRIDAIRGLEGIKEAKVKLGSIEAGVAVVSGIGNAARLLDQIKEGRDDLVFIEVMTCPGGCIAGGGQPRGTDKEKIKARMGALHKIDQNSTVRVSHRNEHIKLLYDEYLGKPLGEKSHHLLHTSYSKRDVLK